MTIYLIKEEIKILKFDKAIAKLALNQNRINNTGIIFPPPPMPAAADKMITRKSAIVPYTSP